MIRKIMTVVISLGMFCSVHASLGHTTVPLLKANVDLRDKPSLQRGAKWYMNYCSGCHSLRYMRYNRLGKDIGIVNEDGSLNADIVRNNLIFTDAKIGDLINVAMPEKEAKQFFGIEAPDLTLEARIRGADWIYTYLMSFYSDPKRPWGVNNRLFPDVAMPNILGGLQGMQFPVYRTETIPYNGNTKQINVIDHLQLINDGRMIEQEFECMVRDLVNFLSYVAEPVKLQRYSLGIWVLGFLVILFIFAYLLKKEFWRDIK